MGSKENNHAKRVPLGQQHATCDHEIDLQKSNVKTIGNIHCIMYRVILKKVSFDIYRIILVSKKEKDFTMESKDKGPTLSNVS